jgi:hypothetical protein
MTETLIMMATLISAKVQDGADIALILSIVQNLHIE